MTDTIEIVARAIANVSADVWENRGVCTHPSSWHHEAQAAITAHTKALIEGAGEQGAADVIARNMNAIAMASQRADGTDIPLGEQCREAARMVMDQAATIAAMKAEIKRLTRAAALSDLIAGDADLIDGGK